MTPEERAQIAVDELRKQPVQIVGKAFFMQVFDTMQNPPDKPMEKKFSIARTLVVDSLGVEYMGEARVTFKRTQP
jgi:hypothetical protein